MQGLPGTVDENASKASYLERHDMPYKRLKGIKGLVYVPEQNGSDRKHQCKDCFCCQWCSDNRCGLCLKGRQRQKACRKKK